MNLPSINYEIIGWRVRKCRCSQNHYWSSLCFDNYFPFVTVLILILSRRDLLFFIFYLCLILNLLHKRLPFSVSSFSVVRINYLSSIQVAGFHGDFMPWWMQHLLEPPKWDRERDDERCKVSFWFLIKHCWSKNRWSCGLETYHLTNSRSWLTECISNFHWHKLKTLGENKSTKSQPSSNPL